MNLLEFLQTLETVCTHGPIAVRQIGFYLYAKYRHHALYHIVYLVVPDDYITVFILALFEATRCYV